MTIKLSMEQQGCLKRSSYGKIQLVHYHNLRITEAFVQEKAKEAKEEEDKNDPMKQLEKRTKASRAEMEAMGELLTPFQRWKRLTCYIQISSMG